MAFDFVVPPLEGLWWSETGEVDYARKQDFHFISMIRLPDFVTKAYANGTQQVPQNDTNVNTTVKALTSLLGAL